MPNNIFSHQVGQIRCTVISDGIRPAPVDTPISIFPHIEEANVRAAFNAAYGEGGMVEFSMNDLLIQTPDRTLLVDTGTGPNQQAGSGELYDQLQMVVDPSAIDTILITHAHGDHIGGLFGADGEIAYPNARILMSRAERDYWMSEEALALRGAEYINPLRARFQKLESRLTLLDGEQEIAPGIRTLSTPGHTPGHLAIMIESDGQRLLHLVDTAHFIFQCDHPDWSPRFDSHPEIAAATRRQWMQRAADEGVTVLLYHFGFPGLGTFTRNGDGFQWQPLNAQV